LNGHFPDEPRSLGAPQVSTCASWMRTIRDKWHKFQWAGRPSWHPVNSIKYWKKHKALTPAILRAPSFLYPPLDSRGKARCSIYVASPMPAPLVLTYLIFISYLIPPPQPLRPFSGTTQVSRCQKKNFWTLWCKGRLTEADTLTIRLDTTPSGLTSAHLHHPHIFYRPDAVPAAQPTVSKRW